MAAAGWPTNDDLKAALLDRGWEFDFHQAVRLLERLVEEQVPVGHGGPFRDERIRFAPWSRLAPTASEVRHIRKTREPSGTDGREIEVYRLLISFFGLYGMAAPGPPYIFEAAVEDPVNDEPGKALRDFLDLFNNRLTAMYYRACGKYRWPIRFRRGGRDGISRRVFSLVGLGTTLGASGPGRRAILADHASLEPIRPRVRLLRYLGLFSTRVRCPANLRGLLWDYFDGPDHRRDEFVEVEEFVTRRLWVEGRRLGRLGKKNHRVGGTGDDTLIVGQRVPDPAGAFRVVLGPLSIERFRGFLPIGEDFAALLALVDLYRPDGLDYGLRLRLRADEVPPLKVGIDSPERLGWSTWLGSPGVNRSAEGEVEFQRRRAGVRSAAYERRRSA